MRFRSMLTVASVLTVAAIAVSGCGSSKNTATNASASSAATGATTSTTATGATTAGSTAAGSTPATSGSSASTINISADPSGQLKFVPTSITTTAGKHKVVFTNNSSVQHDVIFGKGFSEGGQIGEVKKITNSTESKSITFKPGKYTFYCDVAGHRQAGMVGTLIVK